MSITIEGPTFYDQEDENIFFECLYSLPSFKEVKGHGVELTIEFTGEPEEEAIVKLLVICRRWGINISPLNLYKSRFSPENFLWKNSIPLKNT
ncbi:hypothetical protein ACJJIK_13540 [Microbulbifer sp. ZKSA006]|uniref:hypothetical protein n=1 Tax=Microbulbifer sp. ZKSA006 TaxID=3243390 RepID=UPI004039491A